MIATAFYVRRESLREKSWPAGHIKRALVAARGDRGEEAAHRLRLIHVGRRDEALHLRGKLRDGISGGHAARYTLRCQGSQCFRRPYRAGGKSDRLFLWWLARRAPSGYDFSDEAIKDACRKCRYPYDQATMLERDYPEAWNLVTAPGYNRPRRAARRRCPCRESSVRSRSSNALVD